MLSLKNSRFFQTVHRDVEPGVVISEEGVALVFASSNGHTYVRPSSGVAGEVFAGFSLSRNSPPAYLPRIIKDKTVPATGVLDLARVPVTGQILVKVAGEVLSIVADTPDEGEVQLQGQKLYFFAGTPENGGTPAVLGDQGKELYVQFIYEPSVQEAKTVIGEAPIGGLPSSEMEIIGVTQRSEAIGTTFYDASVDWTGVIHPKLGVDGRLTTKGNGTTLTNVIVKGTPVADEGAYGPLVVEVLYA